MGLAELLPNLLATIAQLEGHGSANEANTKHHVIEPLLRGLGWNLDDFNEVDREFRVYDGTFLDYALRIDGKPKLFIEAKALGKALSDKAFIAQTVNYANNEGVVWCVLTNGLAYHVYKSNEPVPMDRKLLFELDVKEMSSAGDSSDVIERLQILSRSSVQTGNLDTWGEQVFVDFRTRAALASLGQQPTSKLIQVISGAIEGPPIDKSRLSASLSRVLGGLATPGATGALVGAPPVPGPSSAPAQPSGGVKPEAKAIFDIAHHTNGKPSAIIDLFEQIDAYAMALGDDVRRRPVKYYIGYFVGKRSFFTLELQKTKIYAYISLLPDEAKPWEPSEMRDVRKIGHYGMGETEFVLHTSEQMARLRRFLEMSYLRNRK